MLAVHPDGRFDFVPAPGFAGEDQFSYLANDGTLSSSIATVRIIVAPTPFSPVSHVDEYTVDEDGALTVEAPGILANDKHPAGAALSAILVVKPQRGTIELNSDGSFTYVPEPDATGRDSFSYRATDGVLGSAETAVSILINAVNDEPVATADSSVIDKNHTLASHTGLLENDTDADGDSLIALLVSPPSHGTLLLQPDGSFVYSPDVGFTGNDEFVYQATDSVAVSNTASMLIEVLPVNEPPKALPDAYEINQDQRLIVAARGVIANDFEPDGDDLSVVDFTVPQFGVAELAADGSLVRTAAELPRHRSFYVYDLRRTGILVKRDGHHRRSAAGSWYCRHTQLRPDHV
jgi:hypothetical protein